MRWQAEEKSVRAHTHTQTELKCSPTIRKKGSLAARTPNQVMSVHTLTQVFYISMSLQLHNMLTFQGMALTKTCKTSKDRQCV